MPSMALARETVSIADPQGRAWEPTLKAQAIPASEFTILAVCLLEQSGPQDRVCSASGRIRLSRAAGSAREKAPENNDMQLTRSAPLPGRHGPRSLTWGGPTQKRDADRNETRQSDEHES